MKKLILILFAVCFFTNVNAQTGIGTITPNASAKLDVTSTDKGFLPPRVALTANNVFAPIVGTASAAAGLVIYNTATAGTAPNNVVPGYYYWNGTVWVQIANGLILDTKSSSFTLSSADNNKIILINSTSAITVTVSNTSPNNLPVGFSCQIIQINTGIVSLVGSGVTLNSANGLSTRTKNSAIGLVMNSSTNGYVFGDSIF